MKKLDAKLKIKLIYCCCCSSKILWVFISFIINFLHFIHILTIRIIFLFLLPTLLFIFHFHLGCFITSFLLQPLRIWESIFYFISPSTFVICTTATFYPSFFFDRQCQKSNNGRSISRNVALLNICVHDVINPLYFEHWTDKLKYFYVHCTNVSNLFFELIMGICWYIWYSFWAKVFCSI